MKIILRFFMAISLLLAATGSYAFFGNDNGWGGLVTTGTLMMSGILVTGWKKWK